MDGWKETKQNEKRQSLQIRSPEMIMNRGWLDRKGRNAKKMKVDYAQFKQVPEDDGVDSSLFVTSSYDASTHFESTCADVLNIYERIMGEPFDFSKVNRTLDEVDDQ